MLKVFISNKFSEEKSYIIEIFFRWLLKIEYRVEIHESENYLIKLPNNNVIEIVDSFFIGKEENDYLGEEVIPKQISYVNNEFVVDKDLPVLFGNDLVEKNEENNRKSIKVYSDVFSSAFFIISRMEEYVIKDRDAHGRFPSDYSISKKFDFLNRPVVNEYAEMLWNILVYLGIEENSREFGRYELVPTHDIDTVYYKFRLSNLLGDIILDKNLELAFRRVILKKQNYWDTFSWMMDMSEKYNLKSTFYFMSDASHKWDNDYKLDDKLISEKISEIKKRGHAIGFHPGYETMKNPEKFTRQKKLLENAVGEPIREVRHHYLRFKVPDTFATWEKNDIVYDSSISYSDHIGFRCGTSVTYPLFNLKERSTLDIKEKPLIIMDILLRDRQNTERSAEESVKVVNSYKEICKRYRIPLSILFHNNSFDPLRWKGWKKVYENYFV